MYEYYAVAFALCTVLLGVYSSTVIKSSLEKWA